jgi:hypothetical protein
MKNTEKEPQTWGDILFAGFMICVATALIMGMTYFCGEYLAASRIVR